ncbi:MAG: metal-dependent transcriptional regulator [Acidobacteriota bacterium]|nr:metal-dependent transcriptional regulator [Acidobacteriota bacterium]
MSESDLTPAMEDYLEAIYCIGQGQRIVRVKNIASRIGVKMPTVTSMLKSLSQKGFIEYEKHEYLELTARGEEVGKEINRRHQALLTFLINILGIDPVVANEEACRIEHGMSPKTLDRLKLFIEFIENRAQTHPDFLQAFAEFRSSGIPSEAEAEPTAKSAARTDPPAKPSSLRKEGSDDAQ